MQPSRHDEPRRVLAELAIRIRDRYDQDELDDDSDLFVELPDMPGNNGNYAASGWAMLDESGQVTDKDPSWPAPGRTSSP